MFSDYNVWRKVRKCKFFFSHSRFLVFFACAVLPEQHDLPKNTWQQKNNREFMFKLCEEFSLLFAEHEHKFRIGLWRTQSSVIHNRRLYSIKLVWFWVSGENKMKRKCCISKKFFGQKPIQNFPGLRNIFNYIFHIYLFVRKKRPRKEMAQKIF